jgi:hypothetical protein
MNKYEVLGIVGEGAYGTVLKVCIHFMEEVWTFWHELSLPRVTHVVLSTRILSSLVSTGPSPFAAGRLRLQQCRNKVCDSPFHDFT